MVFMSFRDENNIKALDEFDYKYYFESGDDTTLKGKLPQVELNQKGIDLVFQYNAYKYQMNELIKTQNVDQLIKIVMSGEFSRIRNSEDDVRIPLLISATHDTPVVYVRERKKEAIIILDSLGD